MRTVTGGAVSSIRNPERVYVGLISDQPIRLEGLASVLEDCSANSTLLPIPVRGTVEKLLLDPSLEFLLVDIDASPPSLATLAAVRRARPELRLIVIGPEGNDRLVMDAIIAGARAYLDQTASPELVRMALDVVARGSIWAPRRLLSKLIDRLLTEPDTSLTNVKPHLTARERHVLELILTASSNREIARQLGIEERTVKAHVSRLMRKTGAENRVDLSMRALDQSLIAGKAAKHGRNQGKIQGPVNS